jgi:hypothetical protein
MPTDETQTDPSVVIPPMPVRRRSRYWLFFVQFKSPFACVCFGRHSIRRRSISFDCAACWCIRAPPTAATTTRSSDPTVRFCSSRYVIVNRRFKIDLFLSLCVLSKISHGAFNANRRRQRQCAVVRIQRHVRYRFLRSLDCIILNLLAQVMCRLSIRARCRPRRLAAPKSTVEPMIDDRS